MTDTYNQKENEIQIGFALHDKTGSYSAWVGTAMQSIIEHTDAEICFHILCDGTLNEENRKKLGQVAERGGHRICFHLLDETALSEFSEQVGRFTIGALFRVILPELLADLPKIIYLDADILVNRDIRELWDMDIQNYCMAAAHDVGVVIGATNPLPVKRNEVARERYFNSGVIYMNLARIREKGNMREAVLKYLMETKEAEYPDQDALNVVYKEDTLLLDKSWNDFVWHIRRRGEKKLEKKIYHYAGTVRVLYYLTEVDMLFFETMGRTPWGLEECRTMLRNSIGRITDRISQFEKMLPQISDPCKKRIFYGEETWAMKNLYKLLTIREGDYRILAEPKEDANCILPCKNLSVLSEEKEPFVVFVLPQVDGGSSIRRLEQLGLENGKDFFVIPRFLPAEQGGYIL